MTSKREVDPEARRLLGALDRIEAEPWPGGMAAYAEALQALAVRLRAPLVPLVASGDTS